MSRLFYHVMQDNVGNLLFDVSGTMRLAGTGTVATIYGDEALTVILPNPMTNHPSFGSFKCFLGAGDYDFYMAKAGYTFETLTGVQGHGTLAQQDAASVAITGGTAVLQLYGGSVEGVAIINTSSFARVDRLTVGGAIAGGGAALAPNHTQLSGPVGLQTEPFSHVGLNFVFNKAAQFGIGIKQANDVGNATIIFSNSAGTPIGSIDTTASATSFNTTSDVRLKHSITALTGALDAITALRPVAFRWNADDSQGHGFLAHELQQVIADAVTGEPDAVNEDGSIKPQQVDHSRLVVWLVSAVQDLAAQVGVLQAHVSALQAQLEP